MSEAYQESVIDYKEENLSTIKVTAYKPSGKYYMDEIFYVHELPYDKFKEYIKKHFKYKYSGGYIVTTELKDFHMSKGFYEYLFKTDELFGGDNE